MKNELKRIFFEFSIYTNADLKISLYARVHVKAIP